MDNTIDSMFFDNALFLRREFRLLKPAILPYEKMMGQLDNEHQHLLCRPPHFLAFSESESVHIILGVVLEACSTIILGYQCHTVIITRGDERGIFISLFDRNSHAPLRGAPSIPNRRENFAHITLGMIRR